MSPAIELAKSVSERGEVVLRRHENGVLELRVNGVFVIDDRETRSEELLASVALGTRPREVLVGGLGLGYTVSRLLADSRIRRVLVAEIEPCLVRWMRDGLIPSVLDDDRVEVRIGDVRDVLRDISTVDAILLDVDNGPDYLVYAANAAVYQHDFLTECRRVLGPDGRLTIWSSTRSEALETAIRSAFGSCTVHPMELENRAEHYFVFSS